MSRASTRLDRTAPGFELSPRAARSDGTNNRWLYSRDWNWDTDPDHSYTTQYSGGAQVYLPGLVINQDKLAGRAAELVEADPDAGPTAFLRRYHWMSATSDMAAAADGAYQAVRSAQLLFRDWPYLAAPAFAAPIRPAVDRRATAAMSTKQWRNRLVATTPDLPDLSDLLNGAEAAFTIMYSAVQNMRMTMTIHSDLTQLINPGGFQFSDGRAGFGRNWGRGVMRVHGHRPTEVEGRRVYEERINAAAVRQQIEYTEQHWSRPWALDEELAEAPATGYQLARDPTPTGKGDPLAGVLGGMDRLLNEISELVD